MNVVETIQTLLLNYPTLFKTRMNCLEHMFLVVGSGFDWVDGELVDPRMVMKAEPTYLDYDEELSAYTEYPEIVNNEDFQNSIKLKVSLHNNWVDFVENNSELIASTKTTTFSHHTKEFYPISGNYSNLCKFPDNIKPDWKEAAIEVGHYVYNNSELRYHHSNKEHARRALEDLEFFKEGGM